MTSVRVDSTRRLIVSLPPEKGPTSIRGGGVYRRLGVVGKQKAIGCRQDSSMRGSHRPTRAGRAYAQTLFHHRPPRIRSGSCRVESPAHTRRTYAHRLLSQPEPVWVEREVSVAQ